MVYFFVIGVDVEVDSDYVCIKVLGEEGVLMYMLNVLILWFLVIFGFEDDFFNCFVDQVWFGLILLIVGVDIKFQFVYVDDVVQVVVKGIFGEVIGIYELGGLEVKFLCGLLQDMFISIYCCCLIVNLFFFVVGFVVFGFDLL